MFPLLPSTYNSPKHHPRPQNVPSLSFSHTAFTVSSIQLLLSQLFIVWIYLTVLAKTFSSSLLSIQSLILGTGKDQMRLGIIMTEKGKLDQKWQHSHWWAEWERDIPKDSYVHNLYPIRYGHKNRNILFHTLYWLQLNVSFGSYITGCLRCCIYNWQSLLPFLFINMSHECVNSDRT